jgi:hypothetical protein
VISAVPVKFRFLGRSSFVLFHVPPSYLHESEWSSFQTHYFSENMGASGIAPGTSESVARSCDHQPTAMLFGS